MPVLPTRNPLFLADHHATSAAPLNRRWFWWFGLVSSALLPLFFPAAAQPLVKWTVEYPLPAAAALASAAALICWQHRPTIQVRFSMSWLAALPVSSRQRVLWEAMSIARLLMLMLMVPFLITALIDHGDQLALLLVSMLVGSGLGFGLAGHAASPRYNAKMSGLRLPIAGPGRDAIAKIPLVWTAARLSGKGMAPWLTATLILIPGGIGGGPSILLIAVTVLTLALVWLGAGAWRHLFLLAAWLAATPLSPVAFARLTLVRVAAWFIGILLMLLAVLSALQMPIEGVIFIFSCVVSGSAACFCTAFRHGSSPGSARRNAALIIVGMSLLVLFDHVLWLMVIALAVAVRELRQIKR